MTPIDRLADSLLRTVSSDRVSLKSDVTDALLDVAKAARQAIADFSTIHEQVHGCPGLPPEIMGICIALTALNSAITKELGE